MIYHIVAFGKEKLLASERNQSPVSSHKKLCLENSKVEYCWSMCML